MITWIYVLIGVAIIYLAFRFIRDAIGMPLLEVKIGTEDGYNYNVEFNKLHPDAKDIEYVRLVLNYLAKILYVIDVKHENQRKFILDYIYKISADEMNAESIKTNTPIGIDMKEGKSTGKVIVGILYFKNTLTRVIKSKLPIRCYEYQLAHSIIVLINIVVEKSDNNHREYLKNSLQYMSKAYNQQSINPKEIKNVISLPNEAFLSSFI